MSDKRILYDACTANRGVSITTWMLRKRRIEELGLMFDEKMLCGEDLLFLYSLALEEHCMYISSLNIYYYHAIPSSKWHEKWPSDDYTDAQYNDIKRRFKNAFK